ncbi:MAG TPA: D-beta-hydroxybutyrate dehydrogenase [Lactobacillus acetotolerans]|jgi:DeoR family glycerol-3-phosphate regulon repressor|nr:D-beta-hydroxybutyrate dehydrogenase [Lactobacillus acetotolerans]
MNASQRKEFIIQKVNEDSDIKIADIAKLTNVSRETIRKDIYELGEKNLLKVVRGGASSISGKIKETNFNIRKNTNILEKKQISRFALNYISDNSSIFLDFGSTAMMLAEEINLASFKDLTVVTNSLNAFNVLHTRKNIQLILLGGMLRTSENSLSGPVALESIDNIYCDIGFFGCGGLDVKAGLTNHYLMEIEVSRKMMTHCERNIVLADHSKFNKKALYQTTTLDKLDNIITDKKSTDIPEDLLNRPKFIQFA